MGKTIDLTDDSDDIIDLTGEDIPMELTKAQKEYLNPSTGFGSARAIATKLGMKLQDVQKELQELSVYQRTLPVRDNRYNEFKIVAEPRSFQIDLTFLPYEKHNRQYPGFLSCIDISSRKAFTYPIKNRSTEEVLKVLETFVKEAKPSRISSDNEGAFKSQTIMKYLEDKGIQQYFHRPNDHNAMGIIDRFTRTIKEMLNKYFLSHQTVQWLDILPTLVNNYNHRQHRSLHMSPQDMWSDIEAQNDFRKEDYQYNRKVLSKTAVFQPRDTVRVLEPLNILEKGRPRYSSEIYTIDHLEGLSYRLRDQQGNLLRHKYRPYELVAAKGDGDKDILHNERKVNRKERKLQRELGKGADKNIVIPKKEFITEHMNLVKILDHGSKAEQQKEAVKQKEELRTIRPKRMAALNAAAINTALLT